MDNINSLIIDGDDNILEENSNSEINLGKNA